MGVQCFTALLPNLEELLLLTKDGGRCLLGLALLVTHTGGRLVTLSFHLCRANRVMLVCPLKGELPTL